MIVDNLTKLAETPYSSELNHIIKEGMKIFEKNCRIAANQGNRTITDTLSYPDPDGWSDVIINFGEGSRCWCLYGIPDHARNALFERAKTLISAELSKRGFKHYNVEGVASGPLYPPLRIFGRPSIFKDTRHPYYSKIIKITADW